MTPAWCGCCSCTYFLDRFTRADNADLGDNWTEVAEAWSIGDYRLETTATNGLCICGVVDDPNNDEHVVSASMRGTAVGDQVRLVSSKKAVDDTYWYFQLEYAATTATLKLYQRVLGADTQYGSTTTLYNMAPGIPLALRICFDGSTIAGQYRRDTGDIWTTATSYSTTSITDATCGVSSGTINGEMRVDDFRLERHGTLYPGCPRCGAFDPSEPSDCYACLGPMPNEFLLMPIVDRGNLDGACQRLLPEGGIVVRRVLGDPCRYIYDFEPGVPIVSILGRTVLLTRIQLLFVAFDTNSRKPGAHIWFHPSVVNAGTWVKYAYSVMPLQFSTNVCGDLADETGWTQTEPFYCSNAVDWSLTAL